MLFYNDTHKNSLKNNLNFWHSVAEDACDGLLIVDEVGIIIYANKKATELFNYPVRKILGVPQTKFCLAEQIDRYNSFFQRAVKENKSVTGEVSLIDRLGSEILIEANWLPVRLDNRLFVKVTLHDVRKPKKTEDRLSRINVILSLVNQCNTLLLRSKDETSLLKKVCHLLVKEGGYRFVWVGFAEQANDKLVRPMAWAGYEEEYLKNTRTSWSDDKWGGGPTGMTIKLRKPTICHNIAVDSACITWREEALKRGYSTHLALPLIINGETIGALNIYSAKIGAFDKLEVYFLFRLADNLSCGILRSRNLQRQNLIEKKLTEAEKTYKSVFENTGTIMVVVEDDTIISLVNSEFEKTSGYTRQDVEGKKSFKDFVLADDLGRLLKYHLWRRTDPLKVPASYEAKLVDKQGSIKSFLLTGSLIPGTKRSIISAIDLTDRIRVEQTLKESEEKFKTLAEYSPNMVFVMQDSGMVYVNPECTKITGYSRNELLSPNFDFHQLIAPESVKKVNQALKKHLAGQNIPPYEYKIIKKNGEIIEAINATKLINYNGKIAIIGIVTDISKQKEIEYKFQARAEALEKINNLLVGRELRMLELKEEIKKLKTQLGQAED